MQVGLARVQPPAILGFGTDAQVDVRAGLLFVFSFLRVSSAADEAPAPLVIEGGSAFNSATGRMQPFAAIVIEGGRIVMEGSRDELLNNEAVRKVYLGENFRL